MKTITITYLLNEIVYPDDLKLDRENNMVIRVNCSKEKCTIQTMQKRIVPNSSTFKNSKENLLVIVVICYEFSRHYIYKESNEPD